MSSRWMKSLALIIAVGLAGCGGIKLGAAGVCKADSDCESGLSCLAGDATIDLSGSSCTATPSSVKTCTRTCASDADCASLVPNVAGGHFKCMGCPGAMTCAETTG